MKRKENYSLLLLAGGKSSRMGKDKAQLSYQGKSFIEIAIDKAKMLGIETVYLSGYPKSIIGTIPVKDFYPDRGPLGGIHACLKESKTPFCLVMPVDVPKLSIEVLDALLEEHAEKRNGLHKGKEIPMLWEHAERKEPLIGIYPAVMAGTIESVISECSAAVFRVLDIWGYECFWMDIEEKKLLDVNTPELYQKLLENEEG